MDRKAYILTFGCQMNEYDSELLESILAAEGYLVTNNPAEAQLLVANTCSVRQKAENRAMARIGQLAAKKDPSRQKLVVGGCMAKRMGEEIIRQIPGVDLVVGPDGLTMIPALLEDGRRVCLDEEGYVEEVAVLPRASGPTAYVAISRGCDNFCAYCIVPYVRGQFRCRPVDSIRQQLRQLQASGVKEVTLLGQNVNSYSYDGVDFPGLLRRLADVAPPRLRFLTSHPKDFSEDLVNCFLELPQLCHWLHLPLQSGSDKILKAMNRGYDFSAYRRLVDRLRETLPDLTLTTDFIVGFPGETEEDFQMTLDAVSEICFDSAFMFRYSVRPGTAAAALNDDVPEVVKIDRLNRLIALQQQISLERNRRWIGQVVEVLIDDFGRRDPQMPKGKARGGQAVLLTGGFPVRPGQMVIARVTEATAKTLLATPLQYAEFVDNR